MTATHDSKGSIVTHQHPIRARALFGSPAPSCLGGAHRRCLLSSEQCCCPCHLDTPAAPYPTPTWRSPVYSCPACSKTFSTSQNRRFHVFDEHPVSATREGVIA